MTKDPTKILFREYRTKDPATKLVPTVPQVPKYKVPQITPNN